MTASKWEYFTEEELMCPCGCKGMAMSESFMKKIVSIRKSLNAPMKINSGFRCPEHNEKVGGSSTSMHLYGRAVDVSLYPLTEEQQIRLIEEAIRHNITGIGVSGKGDKKKQFIHLDNKSSRLWSY